MMVARKNNKCIQQQPDSIHGLSPEMKRLKKESSGFTLIELLTVVTIIGILASIAIMAYSSYVERAKVVSAVSEINTLVKEIRVYMVDHDTPPLNLAVPEIDYGGFRDPWGNLYQYAAPPIRTKGGLPINTEFDVYSMGRDGISAPDIAAPASLDDIIRAGDDHFIGKAERY